tara:strand:- start:2480 stop:3319 length:840 start_codon:yes stop_codon:yes gene_type:complete
MDTVQETVVQTDTDAPVTDSANTVDNSAGIEQSDHKATKSSVEHRDGKLFVDGVRVYTRDDTNKIAANAKREVESNLISELNVDSIDAVKNVVKTLQESTPQEEGSSLNVNSLRDAVRKREATVDELQQQVKSLKTDLLLKDHMSQLNNAMPGGWNADQKGAVVDLMKARNMLAVEGDTFAIRSGDSYLTTDGETPDYTGAVEMVGKTLGLNFGKQGVALQYGETSQESNSSKGLDDARVIGDAEYRSAYLDLRNYQKMERDQISDSAVKKQMSKRRGV